MKKLIILILLALLVSCASVRTSVNQQGLYLNANTTARR